MTTTATPDLTDVDQVRDRLAAVDAELTDLPAKSKAARAAADATEWLRLENLSDDLRDERLELRRQEARLLYRAALDDLAAAQADHDRDMQQARDDEAAAEGEVERLEAELKEARRRKHVAWSTHFNSTPVEYTGPAHAAVKNARERLDELGVDPSTVGDADDPERPSGRILAYTMHGAINPTTGDTVSLVKGAVAPVWVGESIGEHVLEPLDGPDEPEGRTPLGGFADDEDLEEQQ